MPQKLLEVAFSKQMKLNSKFKKTESAQRTRFGINCKGLT
jgi:hypothetical protein